MYRAFKTPVLDKLVLTYIYNFGMIKVTFQLYTHAGNARIQ